MALGLWGRIRFGCKITELTLSALCLALWARSTVPADASSNPDVVLLPVTFGGFLLVSAGLCLGFATADPAPKKIDLLYTWAGVPLFLAAGGLAVDLSDRLAHLRDDRRRTLLGCGAASLCAGLVCAGDVVCSYKDAPH